MTRQLTQFASFSHCLLPSLSLCRTFSFFLLNEFFSYTTFQICGLTIFSFHNENAVLPPHRIPLFQSHVTLHTIRKCLGSHASPCCHVRYCNFMLCLWVVKKATKSRLCQIIFASTHGRLITWAHSKSLGRHHLQIKKAPLLTKR